MKQVITGIVLGIGLSFAGVASAHQVERLSHWSYQQEFQVDLEPSMRKIEQSLYHLNLTTDQQEQIEVLLQNGSQMLRALPYSDDISMQKKMEQLNDLICSEQLDGDAYIEILDRINHNRTQYQYEVALVKNRVWRVLTKQQRESWRPHQLSR